MSNQRDIYPLTIISDRYTGSYSGAEYIAFSLEYWQIPDAIGGSNPEEEIFWMPGGEHEQYLIGKGSTVQESFDDLYSKIEKLNNR